MTSQRCTDLIVARAQAVELRDDLRSAATKADTFVARLERLLAEEQEGDR